MMKTFRPALTLLALFSALLGLLYPVALTGIAQAVFPSRANGSLVVRNGAVVGSELIGQPFLAPGDFWGRSSATAAVPCDGSASVASNLGPSNPALAAAVASRVARLRAADPGNETPVPVDLVTASGSGLDPHVSPAAAYFQADRVARARCLPAEAVRRLVERSIEGGGGIFGERRVNVLLLNLALREMR